MAHGFTRDLESGLVVGFSFEGAASSLQVQSTGVSTVSATADTIVLVDTGDGTLSSLQSLSITADITVSGAGGLDTGSEANNTFYFLYAISDSSGTNAPTGLFSTSATSPTMPAGYDQRALISVANNRAGGGGDFLAFLQNGEEYMYTTTWPIMTSGILGTGAWVAVDTSPYIPSELSNFFYGQYLHASGAGVSNNNSVSVSQTTNGTGKFTMPASANYDFEMSIITADTIYAISDNASFVVRCQGFSISTGRVGTAGSVIEKVSSASSALVSNWSDLKVEQTTVSTVTVTADALVLVDSGGTTTTINTVSEVADITTSGAGGLDTGSEASSTWYYIWVIRNSGTTDVAALLSTASVIGSVTLPSGYDQYALVSAVRNDGSSDFVDFVQNDREWLFKDPWPTLASGNSGSLTVWSSTDVSGQVANGLSEVWLGQVFHSDNGVFMTNDSGVTINIGTTQDLTSGFGLFAPSNVDANMCVELTVLTADTLYYISNDTNGKARTRGFRITKI